MFERGHTSGAQFGRQSGGAPRFDKRSAGGYDGAARSFAFLRASFPFTLGLTADLGQTVVSSVETNHWFRPD